MKNIHRRKFLEYSCGTAVGLLGSSYNHLKAENANTAYLAELSTKKAADSPGAINGIYVAAPSTVVVGEKFNVGIKILTYPYYVPFGCFIEHYPEVVSSTNTSPRNIRYIDNVTPQ